MELEDGSLGKCEIQSTTVLVKIVGSFSAVLKLLLRVCTVGVWVRVCSVGVWVCTVRV